MFFVSMKSSGLLKLMFTVPSMLYLLASQAPMPISSEAVVLAMDNEKNDSYYVEKIKSDLEFVIVHTKGTPWIAARQASLSITNSQSLLKLMSVESVMPSNHLILCPPLLLPPSIFPSIRVFSNESVLGIRWPKYWSFSFSISLSNE